VEPFVTHIACNPILTSSLLALEADILIAAIISVKLISNHFVLRKMKVIAIGKGRLAFRDGLTQACPFLLVSSIYKHK